MPVKKNFLWIWFDAETMTRCVHGAVNIGIAVDSSLGLYVPVLRNAHEVKTADIRSWLNDTVAGIRDRKSAVNSYSTQPLPCLTLVL